MPDDSRPTIYDILMSIKPEDLTENAWLKRADVSRNFFQSVKGGTRPRADTLEKVVKAIDYTPAQFFDLLEGRTARAPIEKDAPKQGLPFHRRDEKADIPLVGSAQGADFEVSTDGTMTFIEMIDLDFNNVIDNLRRPTSLAGKRDVYAITVVGNSMADRYVDGDPAYVDPRRQARPGDYVIVQILRRDGFGDGHVQSVLLKQLVRTTSQFYELRQTNPEVTFTIARNEVAHLHRVIPWREIVFF